MVEVEQGRAESIWGKSHGGGTMQCSRRCLSKGGCSGNGTTREKKTKRYKKANKECKKVVTIAKKMYEELKGNEGRKKIYKLANARK